MNEPNLSRRTILGGAATGMAATLAQTGFGTQVAEQDAIDVGVITEPGGAHVSAFLRALATCRGVRKVAIADPSAKTFELARRSVKGRFGQAFRDYHTMLDKFKPALAVITSEAVNSPPAIRAALERNCHVMTEKPGCVRVEDFEPLVRLSRQSGTHLMMALATRVSSAVKKARRLIRDGLLGRPYSTTMDWIADQTRLKNPAYHKSWLAFKDRAGGGKLIFHGIHYLDLIQHLVDAPIERVSAFSSNVGGEPIEVEDSAVLSFRMKNGLVGTLNTGYYLDRGYQNQVRFWGADGWFHLELQERKPMTWHSTNGRAPRGVQRFAYDDKPGLYHLFLQECIDAATGAGPPPITGRECLQVLNVIFAAYRSAETGGAETVA